MPDPILEDVATRMQELNAFLKRGQDLLNAMKEAGEETGELTNELNRARIRKTKWENMLKARGYKVK